MFHPNANIILILTNWQQIHRVTSYCRCFCSHQWVTSAAMFSAFNCLSGSSRYYQGFVRGKSSRAAIEPTLGLATTNVPLCLNRNTIHIQIQVEIQIQINIFCNDFLLPPGLSLAPHILIFNTNTNTNMNTNTIENANKDIS